MGALRRLTRSLRARLFLILLAITLVYMRLLRRETR